MNRDSILEQHPLGSLRPHPVTLFALKLDWILGYIDPGTISRPGVGYDFTDATRPLWDQDGIVGRCSDRKSERLEDCLDKAIFALVARSVAVKHRLAEKAEQERRKREARRREFMIKKAEEYAVYQKLVALADFMERHTIESREADDRFIADLKSLVAATRKGFDKKALQEEILRLQLYEDDMTDGEMREGGHQP